MDIFVCFRTVILLLWYLSYRLYRVIVQMYLGFIIKKYSSMFSIFWVGIILLCIFLSPLSLRNLLSDLFYNSESRPKHINWLQLFSELHRLWSHACSILIITCFIWLKVIMNHFSHTYICCRQTMWKLKMPIPFLIWVGLMWACCSKALHWLFFLITSFETDSWLGVLHFFACSLILGWY